MEDLRSADIEKFGRQLGAAAEQLAGDMVKHIIGSVDKLTHATGNVVDAKGRPAFDALYEMLDKIEWGLTDDDELSMPTLVGGSDALSKLPELNEEQQAALDDLLRRKHEELLAQRRRRRLS